jgi:hypothetical protein
MLAVDLESIELGLEPCDAPTSIFSLKLAANFFRSTYDGFLYHSSHFGSVNPIVAELNVSAVCTCQGDSSREVIERRHTS